MADESGADKRKFCEVMGVEGLAQIPTNRFEEAKKQLQRKLRQKPAKAKAQVEAKTHAQQDMPV